MLFPIHLFSFYRYRAWINKLFRLTLNFSVCFTITVSQVIVTAVTVYIEQNIIGSSTPTVWALSLQHCVNDVRGSFF